MFVFLRWPTGEFGTTLRAATWHRRLRELSPRRSEIHSTRLLTKVQPKRFPATNVLFSKYSILYSFFSPRIRQETFDDFVNVIFQWFVGSTLTSFLEMIFIYILTLGDFCSSSIIQNVMLRYFNKCLTISYSCVLVNPLIVGQYGIDNIITSCFLLQFSDILLYTFRTQQPTQCFRVHGQMTLKSMKTQECDNKTGTDFAFVILGQGNQ